MSLSGCIDSEEAKAFRWTAIRYSQSYEDCMRFVNNAGAASVNRHMQKIQEGTPSTDPSTRPLASVTTKMYSFNKEHRYGVDTLSIFTIIYLVLLVSRGKEV